nr:hypothetical protein [Tanacetum cinerariifolium]
MSTLVFADPESSTQADRAKSSRVSVPLPEDPHEAIMQAYLEGTDIEFEHFEDPESETDESSHIVALPTCYVEESEGSGTSDARSMSSDSTVPLSPDHPLTHTTPILVPILCRTARMTVHVPPVMSHGLSVGIAEVAAMPDSTFRKRFRSFYDSSPSPTLPVWKRYKDDSRGLESDGLGLEEEEVVLEGQQQGAQSSRVSVPLPEDPYEAIMQAYLEWMDTESEPFEDPESETHESSHIVAPPTCHVKESEGSGTSGARSMSLDSTAPLSPDHPLTHTTAILVPILRRTARMAVHVLPVMSHGLSAGIAEVVAMPDSAFRKKFRSSYDSSPSPTLPVRKRYRGMSELILGADSEEIDESLDFDSESENAKDEGPTAKDEDPAAGDEGLAMGVEGPGVDDESYGLDDESHGLDDESRGLEDDGRNLKSDGLGLGEEKAVPEGQQQGAQSSRVSVPLPKDPYEAIMQAYLEWTDTKSEPFGNPLPEDLYESYGLDDESYGLDDESHGVDDESRGLDDDGRGLESGGLGLGEEVVPEGQQQGALIIRTTVSTPLRLGYGSLRHQELALEDDHVYSTFEVGHDSGSAPEPERSERVSSFRQPTLTTWTDPEDDMVYIDVPVYPPPTPPVQTPPSPD